MTLLVPSHPLNNLVSVSVSLFFHNYAQKRFIGMAAVISAHVRAGYIHSIMNHIWSTKWWKLFVSKNSWGPGNQLVQPSIIIASSPSNLKIDQISWLHRRVFWVNLEGQPCQSDLPFFCHFLASLVQPGFAFLPLHLVWPHSPGIQHQSVSKLASMACWSASHSPLVHQLQLRSHPDLHCLHHLHENKACRLGTGPGG